MRHVSASQAAAVLVAVVALLSAAPAAAAERARISVVGVKGEGGPALVDQLQRGLCDVHECIPADRVRRDGKLDFALVSAQRVGVLFGTVAGGARAPRLALALLTTSFTPRRTWTLPLDRAGRIEAAALAGLSEDLGTQLGGSGATAEAPAAAVRAKAESEPARAPSKTAAVATADGAARGAPSMRQPAAVPRPRAGGDERPRLGTLAVGAAVGSRKLAYQGVGTGSASLQDYELGAFTSVYVRADVYPLARATEGWPAGLALLASYGRSLAVDTEQQRSPGVMYPTTLTQLELGAGWRFHPLERTALTVRPRISWRSSSFKVDPVNGAAPAGLPDAELSGPSLGADLGLPLTPRIGLVASAAYTRWTTAKDLVGGDPSFFSDGSAWALTTSAGATYELLRWVTLAGVLEYERTAYTLSGTSVYSASGAVDSGLSVRITAGVRF